VLFSGLAFWLSLGFQSWFQLDLLPALTLGFIVMAVVFFLVAGLLALIGKSRMTFTPPQATQASVEASVTAVKDAVAKGQAEVGALSLTGKRPEIEQ